MEGRASEGEDLDTDLIPDDAGSSVTSGPPSPSRPIRPPPTAELAGSSVRSTPLPLRVLLPLGPASLLEPVLPACESQVPHLLPRPRDTRIAVDHG